MLKNLAIYYIFALITFLIITKVVFIIGGIVRKNNDNITSTRSYKSVMGIIIAIFGGIPIIFYPVVLIANTMSSLVFVAIFGVQSIYEFISGLIMILIIVSSTVYPIVYIIL